jgi:hypothetical protein
MSLASPPVVLRFLLGHSEVSLVAKTTFPSLISMLPLLTHQLGSLHGAVTYVTGLTDSIADAGTFSL